MLREQFISSEHRLVRPKSLLLKTIKNSGGTQIKIKVVFFSPPTVSTCLSSLGNVVACTERTVKARQSMDTLCCVPVIVGLNWNTWKSKFPHFKGYPIQFWWKFYIKKSTANCPPFFEKGLWFVNYSCCGIPEYVNILTGNMTLYRGKSHVKYLR